MSPLELQERRLQRNYMIFDYMSTKMFKGGDRPDYENQGHCTKIKIIPKSCIY